MFMTTSIKQHWHTEEFGSCKRQQPEETLVGVSVSGGLSTAVFAQSNGGDGAHTL